MARTRLLSPTRSPLALRLRLQVRCEGESALVAADRLPAAGHGGSSRESAPGPRRARRPDATPAIQVDEAAAAAGAEPADAKQQQQQVGSLRARASRRTCSSARSRRSGVPAEEPRPRSPAPFASANRPHLQLGASASTGGDQCFACSKRVTRTRSSSSL